MSPRQASSSMRMGDAYFFFSLFTTSRSDGIIEILKISFNDHPNIHTSRIYILIQNWTLRCLILSNIVFLEIKEKEEKEKENESEESKYPEFLILLSYSSEDEFPEILLGMCRHLEIYVFSLGSNKGSYSDGDQVTCIFQRFMAILTRSEVS